MYLAMNDVLRKPSLLSCVTDVLYLEDKRKSEIKSIVIPARFLSMLQAPLAEIEYLLWQERNALALQQGATEFDEFAGVVDAIGLQP
jgi:hypothetical protein